MIAIFPNREGVSTCMFLNLRRVRTVEIHPDKSLKLTFSPGHDVHLTGGMAKEILSLLCGSAFLTNGQPLSTLPHLMLRDMGIETEDEDQEPPTLKPTPVRPPSTAK